MNQYKMNSNSHHSYLFVPGTKSEEYWNKVLSGNFNDNLPAHVIFDLEDSVPDHLKPHAREILSEILSVQVEEMKQRFGVFVRLNSAGSPFFRDDLKWYEQFLNAGIGIFLSKCASASELQQLILFQQNTLNPIIPIIETLEGYYNRDEIFHLVKSVNFSHVSFGAGDLSLELDIQRNYNLALLQHAMMELVLTAKIHGLAIIDSPSRILPKPDNDWEEALEAECRWSCMNGFDAKYAVHPGQVPIIEKVFGSKWDVDQAVRILDEFNRHDSSNSIRSGITGDYIGLPVLKQALSKLKIQHKNVE